MQKTPIILVNGLALIFHVRTTVDNFFLVEQEFRDSPVEQLIEYHISALKAEILSLQVHRCRELKTQHVYAAKFIPIGHAMEKALIRKEIDIMNHLHHCKLINLHDAFEDEDEMVLIFEL